MNLNSLTPSFSPKTDAKFYFLVPAAGVGSRMNMDIPKQYLMLNNISVLHYVLDTFLRMHFLSGGMVVLHPDDHLWKAKPFLHQKLFHALGGESRHESVLNGCLALRELDDTNPWVLVHDAARPGVSSSMIVQMCTELETDLVGGILALPVVDTVKVVDIFGRIERTLDRNAIYLAQTPQMFRLNHLITALEYCKNNNIHVTDESSAIEMIGLKPKIVLGDINNFKLTYAEDFKKMRDTLNG